MKRRSLLSNFSIFILTTFLIIYGCKKNSIDESTGNSEDHFEIFQIMETVKTEFVRIGEEQNLHPFVALENVIAFAESLEGVASVVSLDNSHLKITTAKGYSSSIRIDEVDENGLHLYRGGEKGTSSLKQFKLNNGPCESKIENNKVLLFAAYRRDFYTFDEYYDRVVNFIYNGDVNVNITVNMDHECTVDIMKTFNQYGLVVLDTHGEFDGVLVGTRFQLIKAEIPGSVMAFEQMLATKIGSQNLADFKKKNLSLGSSYVYKPELEITEIWRRYKQGLDGEHQLIITSKGIRDLLPALDSTVIFANTCFSGFNATSYQTNTGEMLSFDPVQPAWMTKNPIAYYGFEAVNKGISYAVPNDFVKKVRTLCSDLSIIRTIILERLIYIREQQLVLYLGKKNI